MNSLSTNGARGRGNRRHRERMTLRQVRYLSGYLAGISVDPIPMAQNRQAKVEPRLNIDIVVTEYLKFW